MGSQSLQILAAEVAQTHSQYLDEVLGGLGRIIAAIAFAGDRRLRPHPIFEPHGEIYYLLSPEFDASSQAVRIFWHPKSSLVLRPDAEANRVALALLALTRDEVLCSLDALGLYSRWRDGDFL